MAKILIVDDDAPIRKSLREILEDESYDVDEATDGLECISKVQRDKFDVIILDIKMPKMDGIEALQKLQILSPETPVIMLSGHGNIETAVDAVKKGAFDYISKPPDLNRILITIRNAMEKTELVTTTRHLQKAVKQSKGVNIQGKSIELLHLLEDAEKAAAYDSAVLVLGQNGTGKELIARKIHEQSRRANGPLVEVNCAAMNDELMLSELFGHKKGSFTSAIADKAGKFEVANGGTLFLDEIGDMSIKTQAAVLRALQDKKIMRVGETKEVQVDIRLVSATNKDLKSMIAQKLFREDLYHRLSTIVLKVPSLNDRREDIPLLIEYFNRRVCDDMGRQPKAFSAGAVELLTNYNWTGNIRELANVVERLIIMGQNTIIEDDVFRYVIPNNVAVEDYA